MPQPAQHTPPTDQRQHEPNTGRTFYQKLALYLGGLAIGLMFYGWTQYRKNLAIQSQQPIPHQQTPQEMLTPDSATQSQPTDQPDPAESTAQPPREQQTTDG